MGSPDWATAQRGPGCPSSAGAVPGSEKRDRSRHTGYWRGATARADPLSASGGLPGQPRHSTPGHVQPVAVRVSASPFDNYLIAAPLKTAHALDAFRNKSSGRTHRHRPREIFWKFSQRVRPPSKVPSDSAPEIRTEGECLHAAPCEGKRLNAGPHEPRASRPRFECSGVQTGLPTPSDPRLDLGEPCPNPAVTTSCHRCTSNDLRTTSAASSWSPATRKSAFKPT